MADEPHTLGELIDMQIRTNGPMSIATYMGLCLTHPRLGYYKSADPLGAQGDFITAPEVSQMFGELIGFFLVNLWQQLKEPRSFTLLELGPGRGTLMSDVMRVAQRAEGFSNAAHLQLFETNPALKSEQEKRLGQYLPYWADKLDAVSDDPLLVVANEFFDALPIRQFVRGEDGWHERQVGLREGKRALGLSPTPLPGDLLPEAVRDAPVGSIYEAAIAGGEVMASLAAKVAAQGGAILVIDYGYARTQTGETLQAVARHAYTDPLENPGGADLSAHVDFEALGKVAAKAGLVVQPVTPQGLFLKRLGIGERAAALARANPDQMDAIESALKRLLAPDQMGELFKVFVAATPGIKPIGVGV